MLLVQICLAFLLGMLGPVVTAASARRAKGSWYPWSGVLLAAWVAGVSGILVLRFPDWAVLYLFEAMNRSRPLIALFGALLSMLAAWLGMQLVLPAVQRGRFPSALLMVAAAAAASMASLALVRERLLVVVTTFEFNQGLTRPPSRVAGFQGLLTLVAIGVGVPCLGALFLLFLDSRRVGPSAD